MYKNNSLTLASVLILLCISTVSHARNPVITGTYTDPKTGQKLPIYTKKNLFKKDTFEVKPLITREKNGFFHKQPRVTHIFNEKTQQFDTVTTTTSKSFLTGKKTNETQSNIDGKTSQITTTKSKNFLTGKKTETTTYLDESGEKQNITITRSKNFLTGKKTVLQHHSENGGYTVKTVSKHGRVLKETGINAAKEEIKFKGNSPLPYGSISDVSKTDNPEQLIKAQTEEFDAQKIKLTEQQRKLNSIHSHSAALEAENARLAQIKNNPNVDPDKREEAKDILQENRKEIQKNQNEINILKQQVLELTAKIEKRDQTTTQPSPASKTVHTSAVSTPAASVATQRTIRYVSTGQTDGQGVGIYEKKNILTAGNGESASTKTKNREDAATLEAKKIREAVLAFKQEQAKIGNPNADYNDYKKHLELSTSAKITAPSTTPSTTPSTAPSTAPSTTPKQSFTQWIFDPLLKAWNRTKGYKPID